MNAHDKVAQTREEREKQRARIYANLEADLRAATTQQAREEAVTRAATTLERIEPVKMSRPLCGRCGEEVRGVFAQIDLRRYCHDPEAGATCYRDEMDQMFRGTLPRRTKEQNR